MVCGNLSAVYACTIILAASSLVRLSKDLKPLAFSYFVILLKNSRESAFSNSPAPLVAFQLGVVTTGVLVITHVVILLPVVFVPVFTVPVFVLPVFTAPVVVEPLAVSITEIV